MTTKYLCKNFQRKNVVCELCIINKTYIDLQNTDCKSCFSPLLDEVKPA